MVLGASERTGHLDSVQRLVKLALWTMEVRNTVVELAKNSGLSSTGHGCSGATPDCDTLAGALTKCPAPPSLLKSAAGNVTTLTNNTGTNPENVIQSASGSSYLGCYNRTAADSVLNSKSWTSNEMTAERCANHCAKSSFFGTTSAGQ